ncbi:hypothetical protein [Rhodoferax sp.]|uniref:hypothetical protein n=1 Tax=Rhodoferax sp. TaxID=50421 RepID=UPI001ED00E6C|nr:hypothetical protein [Rhodoferax sp.]MBT9507177.1 hypothetical protein [Rhodoferax sp.]
MEKIIENRQIVIRNKVLTLANVRAVAKAVAVQLESIPPEDRNKAELTFVARCDDGSSFQSEDIDIFAEDSVIAQKRVTHVTVTYSFYPNKARVEVALRHGDMDGTITVSGRSRIWVAGTLETLAGLFKSFPPQDNPYLKHSSVINFALTMGIGSIIFLLITLLPTTPPKEEDALKFAWFVSTLREFPVLHYVIKYALTWLVGWPGRSIVTDRFKQLWPSIELQIGPEHLLTEKLRRKLLGTAFVLGVVPLSLTVLYDILKALTGH